MTRISGYFNVTQKNILAVKVLPSPTLPNVLLCMARMNNSRSRLCLWQVAIKKYGPTVLIIDIHVPSFESYSRGYYHDARWSV